MRTLPTAMLRHCAVLSIPAQITGWHEQYSSDTMELEHVHLQRNAGLVQTAHGGSFDMDATVRARLWYDAKISTPHGLNFVELQQAAEDAVLCDAPAPRLRVEREDAQGQPQAHVDRGLH